MTICHLRYNQVRLYKLFDILKMVDLTLGDSFRGSVRPSERPLQVACKAQARTQILLDK